MAKRSASSARGARAGRKGERTTPRRRIDFSDIPEASDKQLRGMRRVGRPPLGGAARQLIAIRVDPDVLERFRKEARRRKVGYQTLINEVLAEHAGLIRKGSGPVAPSFWKGRRSAVTPEQVVAAVVADRDEG